MSAPPWRDGSGRVALAGGLLWAVATALARPGGLTFRDEVGYLGQARLLLEGHARPLADSVCYGYRTAHGAIASYPPIVPIVLAALWAIAPGAVFLFGLASAILLGRESAKRMALWGRPPYLGLAVLLLPVVLILSRTVMADTLLAALTLLAWRALDERGRFVPFAFLGLVLVKPTGIPLAAGLLAGEAIALRRGGDGARVRSGLRALGGAAIGSVAGIAAALALNRATTGSLAYAYVHGDNAFAFRYLTRSAPVYAAALLLVPPGLAAGAVRLVRRRELAAMAAGAGLIALTSVYSFVDSGRTWWESIMIAPRLVLPAATILFLGYVDLLAAWFPRALASRAVAVCLLVLLFAGPTILGRTLAGRDASMMAAREAAERELAARGGGVLGLGASAFKAGLLAREPVVWAGPGSRKAKVVLCSTRSESLRDPSASTECDLDGYATAQRVGPYRILVRSGPS